MCCVYIHVCAFVDTTLFLAGEAQPHEEPARLPPLGGTRQRVPGHLQRFPPKSSELLAGALCGRKLSALPKK